MRGNKRRLFSFIRAQERHNSESQIAELIFCELIFPEVGPLLLFCDHYASTTQSANYTAFFACPPGIFGEYKRDL